MSVTTVSSSMITDATILNADIGAAAAIATTKLGAGAVVQVVNVQDGTYASGTTTIPLDDTIPQITEGNEFMTLAITPTHASNILFIDVVGAFGSHIANQLYVVSLFVGTTANALATAQAGMSAVANRPQVTTAFKHRMVAGVTTELTFRVRAGCHGSSSQLNFNGYNGAAFFGGTYASSITITEIAV